MSGAAREPSLRLGAAILYGLALVYGTLYPLSGWNLSHDGWHSLLPSWPEHLSRTDLLTNVLLYIPFGGLIVWGLAPRVRAWAALLRAVAVGTSLSFVLEVLQQGVPGRVASLSDLVLNAGGTLLGAVTAASFSPSLPLGEGLRRTKNRWIKSSADANVGLMVLALWALSQLSPLVPSADLGYLRDGLRPLWKTLNEPSRFDLVHALTYAAAVCGLGLLATILARRGRDLALPFGALVGGALILKVPIITRELSLEALLGSLAGYLLFLSLRNRKRDSRQVIAIGSVLGSFVLEGLRVTSGALAPSSQNAMNLVPFANYNLNLYDLTDILGAAWAPLALAYLVRHDLPPRKSLAVAAGGSIFVFALAFAVEWIQRSIPGRTPDVTDCLVALIAWLAPWIVGRRSRSRHWHRGRTSVRERRK